MLRLEPVPPCETCEPSPAEQSAMEPQPAQATGSRGTKRAVDYMLEGTSVKENRHLARFARAPYLQLILNDPACDSMMRRQGKALRKEITEAYALLETIEGSLGSARPACVVDLCSGKGFQSLILAHEFAATNVHRACDVLMVDNHAAIKTEHVAATSNLRFLQADILAPDFSTALAAQLPNVGLCLLVGVHLCGPLSPAAVALFGAIARFDLLVLVPCCLDKRTDGVIKAQAKLMGVDPFELKVKQLHGALRESGAWRVTEVRDEAMRTKSGGAASEGAASTKNVILVGSRMLVGRVVSRRAPERYTGFVSVQQRSGTTSKELEEWNGDEVEVLLKGSSAGGLLSDATVLQLKRDIREGDEIEVSVATHESPNVDHGTPFVHARAVTIRSLCYQSVQQLA